MRLQLCALLVAISLIGTGCDDGGGEDRARIRFFNAAFGTEPIIIVFDGNALTTQVYPNDSGYLEVDEGPSQVRGVGQASNTEYFNFNSTFDNDIDYSIATVTSTAGVDPIIFVDENNRPDAENFRVRAVHTAPLAPAVDFYILRAGVALEGQTPTFSSVAFGSQSGYDQIDENEYVVIATIAGTQTIIASTTNDFEDLEVWTAALINMPDGSVGFRLLRDRD